MLRLGANFFKSMEACVLMHSSDGQDAVDSLNRWKVAFENMVGHNFFCPATLTAD